MCHLTSTKLCFLLRPANSGSTHRVPQEACEKAILECGSHENAKDMKIIFEEWRAAKNPIQRILGGIER